jgi:hypothetical protein
MRRREAALRWRLNLESRIVRNKRKPISRFSGVQFQGLRPCGELTVLFQVRFAIQIRFFVYGNLDYPLKMAGYDSRIRPGHYDGKGRIGEWILFQNQVNKDRMGAAVFTTGPYMEMAISAMTPMTPAIEDGVVTWRVPLGNGPVPHVALDDCGY